MMSFEELGVWDEILYAISEMGFEQPMPVQEAVIPYLLGNGNDVVALAQTGTGKTAAFGIPLIQRVDVKKKFPQALVLAPTRELCLQIADDIKDYSKYVDGLKVLPVYGGSSIESQMKSLKSGVQIIVATPGRLLDLMNRKTVKMESIHNVVLDEADEMLNMGFEESLNAILAEVPAERNMMMFSATMSNEISQIAKKYLNNAKEIVIGAKNESTKNVKHIYYMVHAKDKYLALKRIADYYPKIYAIIFCRTRRETQEIADMLIQDGYNADSLHGDLSQAQRDAVMQKFRLRHLQILVATDVAARGLDVDDLTHVINYGLPDDIESYTHRSGRTGRAGKTGTSIAIINMRERGKLREIEKVIAKEFTCGTLPTGRQICEKQLIKVIDDIERVLVNEEEIDGFLPSIYRKLEWLSKEDLIKRVVSIEFNRFLDYYRDADVIDVPTEKAAAKECKKAKKGESDSAKKSRSAAPGFTRLFLNFGKADGFYANHVIELINRNMKGSKPCVGKIDLLREFSFFEVAEEDADSVIKALNKSFANGRRVVVEVASENTGKSDNSGNKDGRKVKKKEQDNTEEFAPKKERKSGKKNDWQRFFDGEFSDPDNSTWAKKSKKRRR